MASVYKVIDQEVGQPRAVKVLSGAQCSPIALELFRSEFARISSFEHPHIVRVFDFGASGDAFYFVMEYLTGMHFDNALSGKSIQEVARVCMQICAALSYIHLRGVVHGDIKPANVIVTGGTGVGTAASGAGLTAKVTDFGLSRMMAEAGIWGGTQNYVAPEVIRGLSVDGRSDLYSLGAMLYETLTGASLFAEPTREALLRAHLLKRPASPRDINPSIPGHLQGIVLKLLEKEPGQRFQTADQLSQALRPLAGVTAQLEAVLPQPVVILHSETIGREDVADALNEAVTGCAERHRGGFFLITGEA
ncbi:MAG: serine/threonine-protein kinase, partial [Candidatus Eisenbacteria bacterium]